jgi:hypothetical protein
MSHVAAEYSSTSAAAGGGKEKESGCNSCLKKVFSWFNGILVSLGALLISVGLYFIFSGWGNVDPSFFLGFGVSVTLAGFIIFCLAWLGQKGVVFQTSKVGNFWTGRKMMAIYCLFLFVLLVGELYIISISLTLLRDITQVYKDLDTLPTNQWPAHHGAEAALAKKFNNFFFGAAKGCDDPKYYPVWQIIDQKCSDTISSLRCKGCGDKAITSCYADQDQCNNVDNGEGPACAYDICRYNFLGAIISNMNPISYGVLAALGFEILLLLCGFVLLCYTKADTVEVQLKKTGTAASVSPPPPTQVRPAVPLL